MHGAVVQVGSTLGVRGERAQYELEPARLRLGLSRVEMLDVHLAGLVTSGHARSPDVDILIEVRQAMAGT